MALTFASANSCILLDIKILRLGLWNQRHEMREQVRATAYYTILYYLLWAVYRPLWSATASHPVWAGLLPLPRASHVYVVCISKSFTVVYIGCVLVCISVCVFFRRMF